MVRVTSPVEGYSGESSYGPVKLVFVDGVAECESLPDAVTAYLRWREYDVDEVKPKRAVRKPADA